MVSRVAPVKHSEIKYTEEYFQQCDKVWKERNYVPVTGRKKIN